MTNQIMNPCGLAINIIHVSGHENVFTYRIESQGEVPVR